MKYLFWIGIFLLIYWFLRKPGKQAAKSHRPQPPREPERMVTCAYCGLNLPVSESISDEERYFCSSEHRHAALSRKN